ncbi:hypothetical protein C8J57DRAFT_1321682 [Mycena rebaudengoi]|nr:hypothetical protein C8J57DRAFT_1321682 [Mycena rebaudengoi]
MLDGSLQSIHIHFIVPFIVPIHPPPTHFSPPRVLSRKDRSYVDTSPWCLMRASARAPGRRPFRLPFLLLIRAAFLWISLAVIYSLNIGVGFPLPLPVFLAMHLLLSLPSSSFLASFRLSVLSFTSAFLTFSSLPKY